MSRIGRLPIAIPSGVDVKLDGRQVDVKGPKGSLTLTVAEPISIATNEAGQLEVSRPNDERESRSLHGLTRTLVSNMIVGVTEGYEKKLEIHGTGYRVLAKGSNLEFALGYSHSITVEPPAGTLATATAADPCAVAPETAKNYEVGAKAGLFNRRLELTAALFRNERTNYRVPSNDPALPASLQVLDGLD